MQLDADIGGATPADLSHAGAIIDRAIDYMVGQKISPLAIASALLGGSLGVLAQSLEDDAILRILDNARECVRAGELRPLVHVSSAEPVAAQRMARRA
jgi:hypothetical protein